MIPMGTTSKPCATASANANEIRSSGVNMKKTAGPLGAGGPPLARRSGRVSYSLGMLVNRWMYWPSWRLTVEFR